MSRVVALRVVAAAALVSGCVRDEVPTAEKPREEIVWDFSTARTLPKARLWPSSASTPRRLKRALTTEGDKGRLMARVDAKDPYFVWQFETSITAALVSIDVEASEAGGLQLFWSSAACPTFRESCSLTEQLSVGRQRVDFLMDRTSPVRELRLDLPDKIGITFWFDDIALFEHADLSPRWLGRPGVDLRAEPYGLDVTSLTPDPWLTVTTPGLDASRFSKVELIVRGDAALAPQIFWDGPCGRFDEACSVPLVRADAGALTHIGALGAVPTWRGAIRGVRLDPGNAEGEYTVERIAFVSEPPNARRARR